MSKLVNYNYIYIYIILVGGFWYHGAYVFFSHPKKPGWGCPEVQSSHEVRVRCRPWCFHKYLSLFENGIDRIATLVVDWVHPYIYIYSQFFWMAINPFIYRENLLICNRILRYLIFQTNPLGQVFFWTKQKYLTCRPHCNWLLLEEPDPNWLVINWFGSITTTKLVINYYIVPSGNLLHSYWKWP